MASHFNYFSQFYRHITFNLLALLGNSSYNILIKHGEIYDDQ